MGSESIFRELESMTRSFWKKSTLTPFIMD
jgi:hypothetical protein